MCSSDLIHSAAESLLTPRGFLRDKKSLFSVWTLKSVRHSGDRDSAFHGPKHTTRRLRDRRWPDDRLTDDVDCESVDRITRQRFQPRCRSGWLTDWSNHDCCAIGRDHQHTIGLTKHLVIQIDANDNTRQLTTPGPPSTSSVTAP